MVHVDDLIEPGAKKILLACLPPFPWPHLVPRLRRDATENHESNLQGIPFRINDFRQIQLPQRARSRFPIKGLGILHGRLVSQHYDFTTDRATGGGASIPLPALSVPKT
jgi:hypothetical protein